MSHLKKKICVRDFGLHKKKLPETRKTKFWSRDYIALHWCIFGKGSTLKYDRTCNISRRTKHVYYFKLEGRAYPSSFEIPLPYD